MATNVILSDAELDKMVQELHTIITSKKAVGALSTSKFCEIWPTAKQILDVIAQIPAAGLVVKIILGIGNAYAAAHCK
jgi:hypothetical protein